MHLVGARVWDTPADFTYEDLQENLSEDVVRELTRVQRLGIDWRDAKCAFPQTFDEGGSMAQPIGADS